MRQQVVEDSPKRRATRLFSLQSESLMLFQAIDETSKVQAPNLGWRVTGTTLRGEPQSACAKRTPSCVTQRRQSLTDPAKPQSGGN